MSTNNSKSTYLAEKSFGAGFLVAVFVGLGTQSFWAGLLFGFVAGFLFFVFGHKSTEHRKASKDFWFPSNNPRLPECRVCGQHDTATLHACRLWIEPEGYDSDVVSRNESTPARILDDKHNSVWECEHYHDSRASRRSCAYQHLLLHQEGSCACNSSIQDGAKNSNFGSSSQHQLSAQATVYIIVNEKLNAVKIGIAGESGYRMRHHVRHGWNVYYESPLLPRHHALQAEQYVLYQWRSVQGLPFGVSAEDMPQNGYTETAPLDRVLLPQVRLMLWEYIGNVNPLS